MQDMIETGLAGNWGSAEKRALLGKTLGIGDTNAKQFLHRMNRLGVGREELITALKQIEKKLVERKES